jgi:hypothetical protein
MRRILCFAAVVTTAFLAGAAAARADGGETGSSPSHTQSYGPYYRGGYSSYQGYYQRPYHGGYRHYYY